MQFYNNPRFCLSCGAKLVRKTDQNNMKRIFCPLCGWTYYANPIPASACIVLRDNNELLLIKRKNEPNPSAWALPSGYVEIDETAEECAVHELYEETGLIGEVDEFLGYFFQSSPIYKRVITFGFLMNITGGELNPGDDALAAKYYSLNNLPDIPFASHNKLIEILRKKLG